MADRVGDEDLVVSSATTPAGEFVEDDELIVSGRRRHPPAWLIVAGVGVLVGAMVAVAVGTRHAGHKAATAPLTGAVVGSSVQPSSPAGGTQLQLGPAVDLALAEDGTLFALGPNWLARMGPGGFSPEQTTTALPAGGAFVAVDSATRRVWVVGQDTNEIDSYDPSSLARISQTRLAGTIETNALATLDRQLFLATTVGIFHLPTPASVPKLLPGFSGAVQTITADPSRNQVLAIADDHSLLQIRAGRVQVIPRSSGGVLPDSLEVTDSGIWAVGFGMAAGPRIARVNPFTLALDPVGPRDPDAPQGANGWPGRAVFWVRHVYSATVICYDARTGASTASYPDLAATGDPEPHAKIVSHSGAAYAIRGQAVLRLKTTQTCPG